MPGIDSRKRRRTLPFDLRPLVMSVWLVAVGIAAPPLLAAQQSGDTPEALTAKHPWIGQPAPDIDLVCTSGETVSLGDFKGKKILVIHFAASR